jgi:hypothetical protein
MGSRYCAAFNATNLLDKTFYVGDSATILFGYEGYADHENVARAFGGNDDVPQVQPGLTRATTFRAVP